MWQVMGGSAWCFCALCGHTTLSHLTSWLQRCCQPKACPGLDRAHPQAAQCLQGLVASVPPSEWFKRECQTEAVLSITLPHFVY